MLEVTPMLEHIAVAAWNKSDVDDWNSEEGLL